MIRTSGPYRTNPFARHKGKQSYVKIHDSLMLPCYANCTKIKNTNRADVLSLQPMSNFIVSARKYRPQRFEDV